jgi:D-alanyl-D-alanine carboxypeptidase/D-alanyl-D-alanine-endopeptidase (penicillin-binding protein 4)
VPRAATSATVTRRRLVAASAAVALLVGCSQPAADPGDAPDAPGAADVDDTASGPATDAEPADPEGDAGRDEQPTATGEFDGDAVGVPPTPTLPEDAEVAPPPAPTSRPQLVTDARALVSDAVEAAAEDAVFGVLVVDEYGREVVAHEADGALMPASTLKVVTAAAVLTTLGPEARLVTRVDTTAPIDADGVVAGDLVVEGAGDPVLATEEYSRWVYPARPRTPLEALADDVVDSGVRRVQGGLLGITDRFPGPAEPEGWPERYFSSFDARYSSGLTVDAGLRTIVTYPEAEDDDGDEGDADEGDADEGDGEGDADPGDEDADDEQPDPEDLGPPDVRIDHAPDPALHTLEELLRLLEERDVEVVGGASVGAVRPRTIGRVGRVASPPMEELLRFAVQRSDNQMTDGLFRVVGRARTGEGSWDQGERALKQVLDRLGVEHDDAVFADGSGLSREDRLTPRMLIELDRAMYATRHAEVWSSLMAEMGESGTLSERLTGTVAQGRFVGKTGTLRDVTALMGAILDEQGEPRYHLAVLANADSQSRWISRVLADELIQRLIADIDGCDVGEGDGSNVLDRAPLAIAC